MFKKNSGLSAAIISSNLSVNSALGSVHWHPMVIKKRSFLDQRTENSFVSVSPAFGNSRVPSGGKSSTDFPGSRVIAALNPPMAMS